MSEENNKEYASGYSRGRSGDIIRDTLNEVSEDHDSQEYKGYKAGEKDRAEHGFKSQDDCGTGETKSGGGFCFLTTACVAHAGLPDDCHELTTLRQFRDDYVAQLPHGSALISEYYATAPGIVHAIEQAPSRSVILAKMLTEIRAIVSQIDSGSSSAAVSSYRAMFERLQRSFPNSRNSVQQRLNMNINSLRS